MLRFTARFFYKSARDAIDARVEEMLALVGLSQKADRPVMGLVHALIYTIGAIGMINGWLAVKAGAIWPNLIAASVMNLILSSLILGL